MKTISYLSEHAKSLAAVKELNFLENLKVLSFPLDFKMCLLMLLHQ